MMMNAPTAILFVFIGCCSNVVFLELVVKAVPGCGTLITCSQFVFISVVGAIFTMECGRRKNVIPIREYGVLVVLFFLVNVSNNLAFAFKISMPLHIIFRSGGLIANLILAMIVLGRRYAPSKYISVLLITAGTIMCTLVSAGDVHDSTATAAENEQALTTWLGGITLLTGALFLSARMGIYQECLYAKHGKHPREALFFIHMLSLPGFLADIVFQGTMLNTAQEFNASPPLPLLAGVPLLATVPCLWWYTVGNALTQYVCISSVFSLTSHVSSLTVTLVLTLRKFTSLLLSIAYFGNPFTATHWAGTALVFGGTLVFSNVITLPYVDDGYNARLKDKKE